MSMPPNNLSHYSLLPIRGEKVPTGRMRGSPNEVIRSFLPYGD